MGDGEVPPCSLHSQINEYLYMPRDVFSSGKLLMFFFCQMAVSAVSHEAFRTSVY